MQYPFDERSSEPVELSDPQAHILGQCALFRDSFTFEAAEFILRLPEGSNEDWAIDVVQSLEDVGMLVRYEPVTNHWRLCLTQLAQPVAALATRALTPDVRIDFKDLHARYFAAFGSETRMRSLESHGGMRTVKILALEHENLDAAIEHALATNDGLLAAGAFFALSALIHLDGFSHDIVELAENILTCPGLSFRQEARLFLEYAEALRVEGCTKRSRDASSKALMLAEKLSDVRLEGLAKRELAVLADQQGEPDQAMALFKEAIALHQQVGNRVQEALDTDHLGTLYVHLGQLDDARLCYEQALLLHREVGNELALATTLGNLAVVCGEAGEIGEATGLFEEAIGSHEETGTRHEESFALGNLGELYLRTGRLIEARDHLEASVALAEQVGEEIIEGTFRGALAELDIREGKVDSARAQVERAESVLREAHDPQDLAKVLCRRGFIEVAEGDEQKARASLGEALALAKQVHAGSRTGVRHLCDDLEALLGKGRTLGHSATQLS